MLTQVNNCQSTLSNCQQTNTPISAGRNLENLLTATPQNSPNTLANRSIRFLDGVDQKLEAICPNFFFQTKLDEIGRYIQNTFAPLTEFNHRLNSNGEGEWYKQLATFLVKLPMRAVRNIVQMFYTLIKEILYTAVHPLKSLTNLAKLFVNFLNELSKPANWSKIGAGIVGASLGQALAANTAVSGIGTGIGAAMICAGLSIETIKAAIEAEKGSKWQAVGEVCLSQLKQMPESMLTGFLMGLIMGSIQKKIQEYDQTELAWANRYVKHQNLPQPTSIIAKNGKITFSWEGAMKDWKGIIYRIEHKGFRLGRDYFWNGNPANGKTFLSLVVKPNPSNFLIGSENVALTQLGPLPTGLASSKMSGE